MKLNDVSLFQSTLTSLLVAGLSTPIPAAQARTTSVAELVSQDPGARINIRSQPSTTAQAKHYGVTGDRVKVLKKNQGEQGFTWFYVQFLDSGAVGWVREDLVHQTEMSEQSQDYKTAKPKTATLRNLTAPIVAPSHQSTLEITPEKVNYFMEIALGSEFSPEQQPILRRWAGRVNIEARGNPTADDLKTLRTVIREINLLAGGMIQLHLLPQGDVAQNSAVTMHFAPEAEFRRLEPGYVPVNYGFFSTHWDDRGTIRKANILITTTGVTQQERSHLIREELTQSLGLMRDSYRYAKSIFYQPWTDTNRYAEIDRAMIRMLYSPELHSGMTAQEVRAVFNSLQAQRGSNANPVRF